jgi:hypothetical protein
MHKKYGKDGLVCVSLSVDVLENKGPALEFLKKQKATFPNYLLNEESEVWHEHFNAVDQPVQVVYDRSGKRHKPFEGGGAENHKEVVQLVEKLLKAGG